MCWNYCYRCLLLMCQQALKFLNIINRCIKLNSQSTGSNCEKTRCSYVEKLSCRNTTRPTLALSMFRTGVIQSKIQSVSIEYYDNINSWINVILCMTMIL